MVSHHRRSASQSGLTNPYRISRSDGVIAWWVWFGGGRAYHHLPDPCMRRVLSFGWFGLHYQHLPHRQSGSEPTARGLYQSLPPRTRGLTIDLSVVEVAHIITHYNDEEPSTPSEVAHTVGKVSKRFFSSGRSACKKQSMVADLVGQ